MRNKSKLLQECMDRAVANKEVGGVSLLAIQNGEETYYNESGYADIEAGKKMNRSTIAHLYSQSKPITAAAAMTLVQDGLIDLYEPVGKYLESYNSQTYVENGEIKEVPDERPMIIMDLMNMTSGLVYPNAFTKAELACCDLMNELIDKLDSSEDKEISTMEFAERLGKNPLNFAPGTHFQYGTSADVLGALIEKVSGKKFSEYLNEKFFEPLEMKDTAFFVPEEKKDRLAKIYATNGKELTLYTGNNLGIKNNGNVNQFESGGAGLFSTVDDYSHFGQMLLNGGSYKGKEILTKEAVKFLTTSVLLPYQQADLAYWNGLQGYSYANLMRVMVEPEKAGLLGNKGEYGWDGWLGTYFMNDPVAKTTFIMFTQMTDYGTGHLTRKLRNILMS